MELLHRSGRFRRRDRLEADAASTVRQLLVDGILGRLPVARRDGRVLIEVAVELFDDGRPERDL
jgi:hypothetical protein